MRNIIKIIVLFLCVVMAFSSCVANDFDYNVDFKIDSDFEKIIEKYSQEEMAQYVVAKIEDGVRVCHDCGLWYDLDSWDIATERYCHDCSEENLDFCCMCGAGYFEYYELVSVEIKNEIYYFCVDCISKYFKTIDTMKPFYYCVECGNLTTCNEYIHSWTGCNICEKCVKGLEQCLECKRYDDEIREGLCGLCGDF